MKNIKRIAFILAMLLLLPVVASCSSDQTASESSVSTSDDASKENSVVESEDPFGDSSDIGEKPNGNLKTEIATSEKDKAAEGKNVIMIQLNSVSNLIMRADSGNVTPFLNSLKEEGVYFSNFFNQASDREDVEYSALNSLLSPVSFSLSSTNSKLNTLAEVLKKSGYSASAFTGVDERYTSRDSFLKRYGFENVSIKGMSDAEIYEEALTKIKSESSKGFYFISNVDSCYPYISSTKNEVSVSGASYLTSYANASAKADAALKGFIENLKSEGLYEKSIIVVYGSSPVFDYTYDEIEEKCGTFLADGIDTAKAHNVPMFILGIDNAEIKDLSSVYDIYPTVVALTGAESKGVLVYGENLFAEADRSEKLFPIQDSLCRGSYITDKVTYLRYSKNSAKCFDRVTGEEYNAADYKSNDTLAKRIANECEYAIKTNYFGVLANKGEVVALKNMYDDLPSVGKLVLVKENSDENAPKAKTALMSFSTQFYYAYDVTNGLYGLKVSGRNIILDKGQKEGTYISPIIDAGEFEVLYTGWDIAYNGGSAEIYVSVVDENGAASSWLQVAKVSKNVLNCTPYEDDIVSVTSSRVYMKNGKSNGKVRIKIKLFASENGESPSLEYFTFTTDSVQVFDSNEADDIETEKAEYKVSHVQAMAGKQSGAAAVACLVSSMTGKKPNITGTSAGIYDQASDSYNNLAAICEYIHSMKIDAFIDILNYDGVSRVLERKQQVLCYMDDTKSFAIIYGFEGLGKSMTYYVYDIGTGKDSKLSATDFAKKWNGVAVVMNTYVENVEPITTADGKSTIIPAGAHDRPGVIAEKQRIVIHNTGNYNPGSGAYNHALYKLNNQSTSTSWHFSVDSKEIYQHLPTNESAFHASDGGEGPGNKYGIGIEICVNGFKAGDGSGALASDYVGEAYEAWEKQFFMAIENAAQLTAQLLVEYNLTPDCIVQHNDMAPDKKNCPMQMRWSSEKQAFVHDGDLWNEFMIMVELRYNRLLVTGDKFNTVNVG